MVLQRPSVCRALPTERGAHGKASVSQTATALRFIFKSRGFFNLFH